MRTSIIKRLGPSCSAWSSANVGLLKGSLLSYLLVSGLGAASFGQTVASHTIPNSGARQTPQAPVIQTLPSPSPADPATFPSANTLEFSAQPWHPQLPMVPANEPKWSLPALEQMALQRNPALQEAEAKVRSYQGAWVQAGLKPNPVAGYFGEEIGDDGTAGKQGAFFSREIITAQKLAKSQAVICREIQFAEQQAMMIRERIQTDVKSTYFRLLVIQQRLNLLEQLKELSQQAVRSSEQLLNAQEVSRSALLQTRIEANRIVLMEKQAHYQEEAAWRELAAIVSSPHLERGHLLGDPYHDLPEFEWESAKDHILSRSPEVAAAYANLQRSQAAYRRAKAQATPNFNVEGSVAYDYAAENTIAGVRIGVPLTINDRNQGGIRQAQAEMTQASQQIDRIKLSLEQQLAGVFQRYLDAQLEVSTYRDEIVPIAKDNLNLITQGYQAGEIGYLELLTAQRTYIETTLESLKALQNLWEPAIEIEGFLLKNSLAGPVELYNTKPW
ncbi:Outer membrane efflux protein [Planctomycetales bacterium 10988]|nr:Outer membrane efflux protein [Planctomycetales bacterium 10988]